MSSKPGIFVRFDRWFTRAVENRIIWPFWKRSTFILSLSLGLFTGLYFRDEMSFPTYLRIKKAYITNMQR